MPQTDFSLPIEGGCRCGAVRYRVTAAPAFIFACHCTDCRQLSSSAFAIGMPVSTDGFALVHGEPRVWTKIADSGKRSHQYWCGICHGWTHTIADASLDMIIVRATTLDDYSWVRPVGQIFLRSAYPWAILPVPLGYQEEFETTDELVAAFARSGIRGPLAPPATG